MATAATSDCRQAAGLAQRMSDYLTHRFNPLSHAAPSALEEALVECGVVRAIDALEMCRWELNELSHQTPGQKEAQRAAEAALSEQEGK